MATLRLNQEPKPVDDEYFNHEDAETSENPEFLEFRKKFYEYQYRFILLAKDASPELITFYKNLAFDKNVQEFYGASDNGGVLQIRRYHVDLYIDFNLSMRKSKEMFEKSCNALWNQIESMYGVMSRNNKDYITDFPKRADGKKKIVDKTLFHRWEKALKVYDLHEIKKETNKCKISKEVELSNKKFAYHKSKEVSEYIDYAKKLIEATRTGNLFNEASTPMTVGKKRKAPM